MSKEKYEREKKHEFVKRERNRAVCACYDKIAGDLAN